MTEKMLSRKRLVTGAICSSTGACVGILVILAFGYLRHEIVIALLNQIVWLGAAVLIGALVYLFGNRSKSTEEENRSIAIAVAPMLFSMLITEELILIESYHQITRDSICYFGISWLSAYFAALLMKHSLRSD